MRKKKQRTTYLQEITPEMIQQVDEKMDEYTAKLIDLDMVTFIREMDKSNVGELRSIRLYLEQKMFEVNALCDSALNPNALLAAATHAERLQLGSLFAVLAKIEAKRGVVDYFLLEREIQ